MRRSTCLILCALAASGTLAACGDGEASDGGAYGRDTGTTTAETESEAAKELAGAPPALAALHEQANELLDGGPDAFRARLADLQGYPVVVNKWASWCPPCRAELPHFQAQALEHGERIAFLGVDSNDNDGDAREFLAEFPVTYPSFKDPDLKVAAELDAVQAFPATAFYDSDGELAYVKQGVYQTEADLAADIERYAR